MVSPEMNGTHRLSKRSAWPTLMKPSHTVKKVIDFAVPSRDETNQTLPGQEKFNSSLPGRVWIVTFRLGTEKSIIFFDSVTLYAQARDAGIWWGTLGKLQLMLRKAAKVQQSPQNSNSQLICTATVSSFVQQQSAEKSNSQLRKATVS